MAERSKISKRKEKTGWTSKTNGISGISFLLFAFLVLALVSNSPAHSSTDKNIIYIPACHSDKCLTMQAISLIFFGKYFCKTLCCHTCYPLWIRWSKSDSERINNSKTLFCSLLTVLLASITMYRANWLPVALSPLYFCSAVSTASKTSGSSQSENSNGRGVALVEKKLQQSATMTKSFITGQKKKSPALEGSFKSKGKRNAWQGFNHLLYFTGPIAK